MKVAGIFILHCIISCITADENENNKSEIVKKWEEYKVNFLDILKINIICRIFSLDIIQIIYRNNLIKHFKWNFVKIDDVKLLKKI